MPVVYLPNELYDRIIRFGEEPKAFVKRAVEMEFDGSTMAAEARKRLDGVSRLLAEHGFVKSHQVEMNDFAAALQLLDRMAYQGEDPKVFVKEAVQEKLKKK